MSSNAFEKNFALLTGESSLDFYGGVFINDVVEFPFQSHCLCMNLFMYFSMNASLLKGADSATSWCG